ncbi:MAG: sigma 54-interacting transcriptional regulator [Acidobacteriota bacterium]
MSVESPRSLTDAQTQQSLLEIFEAITSHRDLPSLFRHLVERLHHVAQFEGAIVLLHDAERNVMREYLLESLLARQSPLPRELPIDAAPGGLVWQTQQPLLVADVAEETSYPEMHRILLESGVRSYCLLPLTVGLRRLGTLGFASRQIAAYGQNDLGFLQQVTNLVALAVDNTLNFQRAYDAQQRLAHERDRLQLLLEINNAVVSALDLRQLMETISPCLRRVVHHDFAGLLVYDPESDQLRAHALDFPNGPMTEGVHFSMEGTPSGLAFRSRQTVLVNRQRLETFSSSPLVKLLRAEGVQSGCSLPLLSHDRALGVLTLMSQRDDNFTEEQAELLTQIAGQIAIAVDNALNFERARKAEQEATHQSDRLGTVLQINNAVVSQLDLRELLQVVSRSLRRAMHNDTTGVALYDPESNKLRVVMTDFPEQMNLVEESYLIALEGSAMGVAFTSGEPVFLDQFDLEKFPSEFTRRSYEAGLRSACNIPLIARGRKLGALGVASKRPGAFSAEDKELLCQSANQIAIAVENALAFREIEMLKNKLASEKYYLEDEIRTQHNFEELIGESQTFRRILKQVETVAPTGSTVLICGETGTGKELIARAIHDLSDRRERTLVKINCAAIPTGLLESELFGHERGAFTGAISQRIGRFELAHRGTLFLDEVGDIPLELQPKLLRVLQEQEFERLGSTRTQKVDARLIAATNCDLERMVADRKYRSDLFYRLNVFPITIPPLRERREDIPALTRFFTQRYARRLKRQITAIPSEVMVALTRYSWPGNVRELEHFIERAVILTRGSDLEVSLAELKSSEPVITTEIATLQDAERDHILRALEETNWVISGPQGAAARLGMKRSTLQSRMQKLGISRQR